MSQSSQEPRAGCYRLARGVRLVQGKDAGTPGRAKARESIFAIRDYPLSSVRLNALSARLLALCVHDQSCAQLAHQVHLPLARVEALCASLWQKDLLERGPFPPLADWPAVSIVVPGYNRARELERCLRSLLALRYPPSCLEIIVVDDASTDQTTSMLQALAQQAAARQIVLRVLRHEQRRGVARARNTGAEGARHELIAYIDSDCVASPGWLAELVPAFQEEGVASVGGMIRALDCSSLLGRYEDVRSSLFMGGRMQYLRLAGPLTYLPTANLIVRRSAWQQLAGFVPLTHGEDVDFCHRLLLTGARILYLPHGVIYHDYRTSWRAFLRIRVAYASSEAALLRRQAVERRVLLLPPQQATFAVATLRLASRLPTLPAPRTGKQTRSKTLMRHLQPGAPVELALVVLVALAQLVYGTWQRHRRVRAQRVPIGVLAVLKATLRGNLAYTYHLCRHLVRYYTLPLLLLTLLFPPLFALTFALCTIVLGVDYARLRPRMSPGAYVLCSILDDCAYEVGVLLGCLKHRSWRPLVPDIKYR